MRFRGGFEGIISGPGGTFQPVMARTDSLDC